VRMDWRAWGVIVDVSVWFRRLWEWRELFVEWGVRVWVCWVECMVVVVFEVFFCGVECRLGGG